MDVKKMSDKELSEATAEQHRRRNEQDRLEMEKIQAKYPCPECGAVPVEINTSAVEEYRFAPRDDEGRAMLYAPYEMGTTGGLRYEMTAVCENGHRYLADEKIKWFDEPHKGPPILGKR